MIRNLPRTCYINVCLACNLRRENPIEIKIVDLVILVSVVPWRQAYEHTPIPHWDPAQFTFYPTFLTQHTYNFFAVTVSTALNN